MALTATWDKIEDAQVEQSLLTGGRLVRTGIVRGIRAGALGTVTSSTTGLIEILANAPNIKALGDSLTNTLPGSAYFCVYSLARPIPGFGGEAARVWQHFETPGGGGTPIERFAAEDSGTLVVEPVNRIPGTNELTVCRTDSSTSDPVIANPSDPANVTVTLSHPHVYRSLVLYGLFADRPSTAILDAENTVNHDTWQSRPRGYWRSEPPRVRWSSRDGMYATSVGFLTKGKKAKDGRDWSTYQVAVDPTTGLLCKPTDATMQTLLGQTYEYGKRWARDGIYKAGLYETSNFTTIFGSTFPIGS